jgi:hypothetical protein
MKEAACSSSVSTCTAVYRMESLHPNRFNTRASISLQKMDDFEAYFTVAF